MKHLTLLTCVSASGECLTSMIGSSQNIPVNIKMMKIVWALILLFRKNAKPYINSNLFNEYIGSVVIPYINDLRFIMEFSNKEGILLMVNCNCHAHEDVLKIFGANALKLITFAPHTTNEFQMLDLSFVGALKKKKHSFFSDEIENDQLSFLSKLLRACYSIATPFNIWGKLYQSRIQF